MEFDIDTVREITQFAGLAPSVHNTQPWTFVATGHTLEVRADTTRMLSYLDPTSRQLHVSCGMAVEFARLAIRSLGYDAVVRLRPGDDPRLLATITMGRPQPPTATERSWVEAAPRRYTDRGAYDETRVPSATLDAARAAAADRGCWLRVLDRPGERVTAALLLDEAEQIEASDARYREEMAAWRRTGAAADGVPDSATVWTAPGSVTDVPLRDFTGHGRLPTPGGEEPPPAVQRDTLVLIGSDDDTPIGWLRTGRALALVLLTFTDAGVVTQPLGPITDVPATRVRLQRQLGLLGHPQLLLRAGYGHGRPRAGRRSVEDILTVTS